MQLTNIRTIRLNLSCDHQVHTVSNMTLYINKACSNDMAFLINKAKEHITTASQPRALHVLGFKDELFFLITDIL